VCALDGGEVLVAAGDGVVEVDDFSLFVELELFVVDVACCEQVFCVVDY
jgi:hypothetical protein